MTIDGIGPLSNLSVPMRKAGAAPGGDRPGQAGSAAAAGRADSAEISGAASSSAGALEEAARRLGAVASDPDVDAAQLRRSLVALENRRASTPDPGALEAAAGAIGSALAGAPPEPGAPTAGLQAGLLRPDPGRALQLLG